jgi:hypothetical protein
MLYFIHQIKGGYLMMMDYEKANEIISIVLGVIGLLMCAFGGMAYFVFEETWQIVIGFLGIGVLGLSYFATL